MIRYYDPGLTWTAFRINGSGLYREREAAAMRRLARILEDWDGTDYQIGQCQKRVGTYCTAFLCAVLDEMYRRPAPRELPSIPDDAAMHDPESARAGLRWFLRAYPSHEEILDGNVQPGDVLVTGPRHGGPGHAILVGPQERTAWHCSPPRVHRTGLMIPDTYELHAVYRMTDRKEWL